MVVDGFRPDRRDVIGALVCLVGVAVTRTLLLVTGAWDAVRMWLRA
jgi:drug/metabolite transporter superfamily protein YnfA